MSRVDTLAVQAALVQAMLADSGIAALVGDRVYDDVPDGAQHPYISLGPEDWQHWEDMCLTGSDGTVQIDIWSAEPGRAECKQITDRVAALFNRQAPVVPGAGAVISAISVFLVRYLRDQQSNTRHGVVQVQITAEGNDP